MRRLWLVLGMATTLVLTGLGGYLVTVGVTGPAATGAGPAPGPRPPTAAAPPPRPAPTVSVPPSPSPVLDLSDAGVRQGPSGSINGTGSQQVALTFDDGPDPTWTPRVLDLLAEYDVRATFCMIGSQAAAHPKLVARVVAEGHSLCNHSWNHELDLGRSDAGTIRDNLERTNEAIHRGAPGAPIDFYRQPGGEWTQTGIEVAGELGMSGLHWSVDPRDWDRESSAGHIRTVVLNRLEPGGIVLMHDGGNNQRAGCHALRRILPELASRYRMVALA